MLSDGEYVIRAGAARKFGRGALDWLNAGHYADGGDVSGILAGIEAGRIAEMERRRREEGKGAAGNR